MITQVERDFAPSWIHTASQQELMPYTPLKMVSKSMTGKQPVFSWHSMKMSSRYEIWILCDNETHSPAMVSHVAAVQEVASRPHGTYVPDSSPIPGEYNPDRVTRNCNFTTKQYWKLQSPKEDVNSFGSLMSNVEKHMYGHLAGVFGVPEDMVSTVRSQWNIPNNNHSYYVEHPLIGSPSMAAHRGDPVVPSTLHPYIVAGLQKEKEFGKTLGKNISQLVEIPGRPSVMFKPGSYHDPTIPATLCEKDDDYHKEDDIVWIGGTIWCLVNKSIGRKKSWTVEFRPETLIRIAVIYDPIPKKSIPLKAVDLKKRLTGFMATPSMPKLAFRTPSKNNLNPPSPSSVPGSPIKAARLSQTPSLPVTDTEEYSFSSQEGTSAPTPMVMEGPMASPMKRPRSASTSATIATEVPMTSPLKRSRSASTSTTVAMEELMASPLKRTRSSPIDGSGMPLKARLNLSPQKKMDPTHLEPLSDITNFSLSIPNSSPPGSDDEELKTPARPKKRTRRSYIL